MGNTTISIFEDTRERLKKCGVKGDTYDDIINDLIDECNE